MKNLFLNFIVSLRNSSLAKKVFVDISINHFILKILDNLYLNGFIIGYQFISKYKIRVFLKYKEQNGLLDKLILVKSSKSGNYVSHSKLSYLYTRGNALGDSYLLLSTAKGLVSYGDYCFYNLRVGGLMLLEIKS